MDLIREAFQNIKKDINELRNQIIFLNNQISLLKYQIQRTNNYLKININNKKNEKTTPTISLETALNTSNQTDSPTQNPTIKQPLEALYSQNLEVSTGNRGVPTDKPTDRQTNQQTDNIQEKFAQEKKEDIIEKNITDFEKMTNILNSLDSLKKEIRLKFKRLTAQEMLVFSTLYTLQEQKLQEITYKTLANNLNLSESSIREYVNKLINKHIPILKIRQNNKKITLSVSEDLQKIASLSTIKKLREL